MSQHVYNPFHRFSPLCCACNFKVFLSCVSLIMHVLRWCLWESCKQNGQWVQIVFGDATMSCAWGFTGSVILKTDECPSEATCILNVLWSVESVIELVAVVCDLEWNGRRLAIGEMAEEVRIHFISCWEVIWLGFLRKQCLADFKQGQFAAAIWAHNVQNVVLKVFVSQVVWSQLLPLLFKWKINNNNFQYNRNQLLEEN